MSKQTYDPRNGTILVTGASSGIGEAVVRQLSDEGYKVAAVARREDRLAVVADETGCETESLDMRDEISVDDLLQRIRPAVIINCAGTAHGLTGLTSSTKDDLQIAIETGVLAALRLFQYAVPIMKGAGGGHIINIGSISGIYPIVSPVYGAAKGGMHMAMQNLRLELGGSGIRVSEIVPGRTDTDLYDSAGLSGEAREKLNTPDVVLLTANDVASAVLFVLNAPLHVNIGMIELTPTEQALGGAVFTPYSGAA